MAGPGNVQGEPNPLGKAIGLLIFLGIGLWWADVIEFDGDGPSNAGWRLFGWAIVVMVGLQWRALFAGGVIVLRLIIILFVAASLAWVFSGDRTLWNF